ncbi:protein-lysine methyltransferase mettl21d-like [Plakobranchus ocellatus]|uniref:Protein-lysine methyltransferase mettl21d-like n=1 Tax=Plakobranchus ocellatus TaxID=259542 RepID=A0AAV4C8A2_9GAST|nr:protein-lysine methyltransferase mettl21d-like [Plakobranchus ocellatus]
MAVDLSKLYDRDFELSSGVELTFLQSEMGDVGCVVWDAALALCGFLDHCQERGTVNWSKQAVLELGAGTGAVGLVAASLGANSVVSDLPELVPLIKQNIDTNREKLSGSCQAAALTWGDEDQMKSLKDASFPEGPDYIMVADCVYYQESVTQLVETIVCLSSSKTTVLCSYEDRELGDKEALQAQFFKLIGEHFTVSEIPMSEQHPELSSPDIHIMKFSSKS